MCTPCLPPCCTHASSGRRQRRLGEDRVDTRRATAARSARTSAATPASTSASVDRVGDEHLARVRPQVVDRRLHARVRLVGAVAQADHPVAPSARRGRSTSFTALAAISGDARIGRLRERAQQQQVPVVEQELARHRVRVVAVRLLDQQQVAELAARRAGTRAASSCARPRCAPRRRRRRRATAAPGRGGRARRWSARCPPRGSAPCRPTRTAAARARGRCRRGAAGTRTAASRSSVTRVVTSEVLHFIGHREERRMPVDLAVARARTAPPGRPGCDATTSAERTTQIDTPSLRRV